MLIITLSVNGLNSSTKGTEWLDGLKKNNRQVHATCKRLTTDLNTHRLKVMGWKKIFHARGNRKEAGVALLLSDKIDFKPKIITRYKEGHYIMRMGSIREENVVIISIYGAPKYIKQVLTDLKGETGNSTTLEQDQYSI